jgi:hypothetical protein
MRDVSIASQTPMLKLGVSKRIRCRFHTAWRGSARAPSRRETADHLPMELTVISSFFHGRFEQLKGLTQVVDSRRARVHSRARDDNLLSLGLVAITTIRRWEVSPCTVNKPL